MNPARAVRWDELDVDHPMELIDRRRIVAEKSMIAHVTLHAGFKIDTHHHENEQIAIVQSGRVKFTVGDPAEEIIVEGGGVLVLPSNVPHAAEALETSVVLDVFCPPSESTGVDARS